MTVEGLAGLLEVNKAHVSRMERGLKEPSLGMVAKLAKVLGTTISYLVGETLSTTDIKVTRKSEVQPRNLGVAGHLFAPLTHGASTNSFDAFVVYPVANGAAVQAQHGGQEMLYVLTGAIDVGFSGRTERISAGDCIQFPGHLTHSISQVGVEQASALLVISLD
jgi:mannose-6-phosphate isomerase-like protein (cupin superfamily)